MELLRLLCVRRVLFCPRPGLPVRAGAGSSAAGVSGPGEDERRGGTVTGHVSGSAAGWSQGDTNFPLFWIFILHYLLPGIRASPSVVSSRTLISTASECLF